ncbi:tubulin tyrosine ligase-like protein [Aureococcus anophagefferens]|uniref:Tubulin tyrosine ligase-like protein n=1 Tax=Aureococcus anophagefferens TaxID=44056 RepID=A0ABR1G3G9_AURAN
MLDGVQDPEGALPPSPGVPDPIPIVPWDEDDDDLGDYGDRGGDLLEQYGQHADGGEEEEEEEAEDEEDEDARELAYGDDARLRDDKEQYKRLMATLVKKRRSELAAAEESEAEQEAFRKKVKEAGLRPRKRPRSAGGGDGGDLPAPPPAQGSAAKAANALRPRKVLEKQNVTDAPAAEKKEPTPEEKAALAERKKAQRASVDRLLATTKPKEGGQLGRDFEDYKRKQGIADDTKVFCMTGWYPCVKDALLDRGWHFNDDRESEYFDLKWTLRSNELNQRDLKPWQLTNHFLKNTAITTKAGLTKSLRGLHWFADASSGGDLPRAHDLSNGTSFRQFLDDFRGMEAERVLKLGAAPPAADDLDELDGVLEGAGGPPRFNEATVRLALHVCWKKQRQYLDDDAELERGLRVAPRRGGRVGGAPRVPRLRGLVIDLPRDMPPPMDADMNIGDDEAELREKKALKKEDGDKAGSILARAREERLAKAKRADDVDRRLEIRDDVARAPVVVSRALLDEIDWCFDMLAEHDPQFHLNGGRETSRNLWIAKPAAKSRGRGIATFDDLDKMLDHCDAKTGGSGALWIVQKYMESQLLIAERKFDLRQWVLVTDWNPLTIYFYDECYARFSAEKYSDTSESLENPFVHMVNNSIVKNSDKFHAKVVAENGVEVVDCMWSLDDFRNFLNWREAKAAPAADAPERAKAAHRAAASGGDVFRELIQPKMIEIATRALQCAQEAVEHRKNSWELYGYDFMIDGELNPWLIEVNSSPACDYSTKVTERYVQKALVDVLKVTVDRRKWEAEGGADRGAEPPDAGGWRPAHAGAFVETPIASLTGGDICCVGAKVTAPRTVKLRLQAAKQAALAAQRLAAAQKRKELADRHGASKAAPRSPRSPRSPKPGLETEGLEVTNGENSPRKRAARGDDSSDDADSILDGDDDATQPTPTEAVPAKPAPKPSPEKPPNAAHAKAAPPNAKAVAVTTFEFN